MEIKSGAILLALFFGGLGLHWFYLNRPLRGVIYLLCSWTFIPAILALIEAIWFASLTSEKLKEKYR